MGAREVLLIDAYPGPGPVGGASTTWIGAWAVVVPLTPAGSVASGPVPAKVAWLTSGSTAGAVAGLTTLTVYELGPLDPAPQPAGMDAGSANVQVTVFAPGS